MKVINLVDILNNFDFTVVVDAISGDITWSSAYKMWKLSDREKLLVTYGSYNIDSLEFKDNFIRITLEDD